MQSFRVRLLCLVFSGLLEMYGYIDTDGPRKTYIEHLAKKDFVALSFLQNIFSECPGMRFFIHFYFRN